MKTQSFIYETGVQGCTFSISSLSESVFYNQ